MDDGGVKRLSVCLHAMSCLTITVAKWLELHSKVMSECN